MKKYIIILCMFLGLCGCGKSDNVVKKFQNKIEKADNYILKGNMSIVSNEDTFTYKVEASKSKEGYYKVSLINQTNNHEQVILKNKDGVYVVTPDLNKSFKFQSDWPNSNSQIFTSLYSAAKAACSSSLSTCKAVKTSVSLIINFSFLVVSFFVVSVVFAVVKSSLGIVI